jgi:hypothetical protein
MAKFRRAARLIVLCLIISTVFALPSAPARAADRWYVSGDGAWSGDGRSCGTPRHWRNLDDLPLQPGDEVLFLPQGSYNFGTSGLALDLTTPGVTLRGAQCDGTPTNIWLEGNRSDPYVPPSKGGVIGGVAIRLSAPARDIVIDHLSARNLGTFLMIRSQMDAGALDTWERTPSGRTVITSEQPHPLVVRHVRFRNVRTLVDVPTSTPMGRLENALIQDVAGVGFSKALFMLRANNHHNRLEDLDVDSAGQNLDNFAAGIIFLGNSPAEANTDNLVRNLRVGRLKDTLNRYRQGDCVSSEEYDTDLRVEGLVCEDASDGAVDLKARAQLVDITCLRVRYCVKVWYQSFNGTRVRGIKVTHPGGAGFAAQVTAVNGADLTLRDSDFVSLNPRVPLVDFDPGSNAAASVILRASRVVKHVSAPLRGPREKGRLAFDAASSVTSLTPGRPANAKRARHP